MRIEYLSATRPMKYGRIAPPTTAVTIHDAASLVFSPSPRMPSAKCVGYMMDIKKKLKNSAATDSQPSGKITSVIITTLMTA